ncbi:MAG: cation diffusion facilitator family transporter [Oryzihumus sp.]
MGHGHSHTHGLVPGTGPASTAYRGRLRTVLLITLGVVVAEVVGAALSGSLALWADAAHMAADAAGLAVALLATHLAHRPPTMRRTFGYQRAEVLAALGNATLLLVLAGAVGVQGVERLLHPATVRPGIMLWFGVLALAANSASLLLLRQGQAHSINVRGAFLEVLSDALASAGVIAAAVVVALTGWSRADAVVSLAIAVMILPRAWNLLREAGEVLLESVPPGVDLEQVRDHLLREEGVRDVHDLHSWTITSGVPVMSAHIVVDESAFGDGSLPQLLDRLQGCLEGHFDVAHSTLQLEAAGHGDHEPAAHQ